MLCPSVGSLPCSIYDCHHAATVFPRASRCSVTRDFLHCRRCSSAARYLPHALCRRTHPPRRSRRRIRFRSRPAPATQWVLRRGKPRDASAIDAETAYNWASITKTITAIAILQLRDRGLLSLDDPAVRYVPELRQVHNAYGPIDAITIRHLLTHSAGFRNPTWPWDCDDADQLRLAALRADQVVAGRGHAALHPRRLRAGQPLELLEPRLRLSRPDHRAPQRRRLRSLHRQEHSQAAGNDIELLRSRAVFSREPRLGELSARRREDRRSPSTSTPASPHRTAD